MVTTLNYWLTIKTFDKNFIEGVKNSNSCKPPDMKAEN